MDRMLEVTISGTYFNSKREIIDFENVKGKIPYCDDERAAMHVRGRYARTWIKNDDRYEGGVSKARTVYIDDIKETTGVLSFVGKDIKTLSFEELQDLATAKDLRLIPAVKDDLRMARVLAYVDYNDKVLKGDPIKYQDEKFNFAKLPPIIMDGEGRADNSEKLTNDEILEQEVKTTNLQATPKTTLTLADLKGIAKEKNISHSPNIGFDALYAKLYGIAS